jgi:alkylation response protein AidB-like acyl-CoA dehydrogenase
MNSWPRPSGRFSPALRRGGEPRTAPYFARRADSLAEGGGLGTVRIPREKGGWGASLPQLIALLIELAKLTPTCRRRCAPILPLLKIA